MLNLITTFCGSLIQQTVNTESSGGQSAYASTFSQKRADRPLMHLPLHGLNDTGLGLVVVVVVVVAAVDGCLVAVNVVIIVVIVVAVAIAETLVDNDVFGLIVVNKDETLLSLALFFSSKRVEFRRSITRSSGGGDSPKASLDTQHL